jgi:hypothetical protein
MALRMEERPAKRALRIDPRGLEATGRPLALRIKEFASSETLLKRLACPSLSA